MLGVIQSGADPLGPGRCRRAHRFRRPSQVPTPQPRAAAALTAAPRTRRAGRWCSGRAGPCGPMLPARDPAPTPGLIESGFWSVRTPRTPSSRVCAPSRTRWATAPTGPCSGAITSCSGRSAGVRRPSRIFAASSGRPSSWSTDSGA
ncbi:hypothetical protein SA11R_08525 [Rothia kristinae]|nr:hypothetical protein SA11R_08525 [Rothia kristinae]